jgi:soluble lytic murein transglycosylase-like protein
MLRFLKEFRSLHGGLDNMPTYRWKGQLIRAPSLEALQLYIKSQSEQTQEENTGMWKPDEKVAKRMEPYKKTIEEAEKKYGIPPTLLARQLMQESAFKPDIISGKRKSPVGAVGIAQFMPATAEQYGVDPLDPEQAIEGAARYMKDLRDKSDTWADALAKYNWGMGNFAKKGGLPNAPKETKNYVASILKDVGDVDGG